MLVTLYFFAKNVMRQEMKDKNQDITERRKAEEAVKEGAE
jgi:hypothetical protein